MTTFSTRTIRQAVLALTMLLAAGLGAAGCAAPRSGAGEGAAGPPPEPMREFRAAWVATVANIDWPSQPGLTPEAQRAELRALMDRAVRLHLNAIVLQVRPAADALYESELEPWSEYLTGRQGRAPEPFYDPLAFAVEEAHARGLDLHAWFNPFRARHPTARSDEAEGHVSRARPDWVRRYGDYLWLDPAVPEAREHSLAVILDVVRRYDVDGVHLDDYFYPYPITDEAGRPIDFPDEAAWRAARATGDMRSRDDWRRGHIDAFVEELYRRVRAEKPHVLVGISPFGIWRPGHPPSVTGFDPYTQLYADSRRWLREGWVDYWTPQLYWPVEQTGQRYDVLLDWWAEQNVHGRHLWPGNFTSRVVGERDPWPAEELIEQIRLTRAQPGASGNVHFSMKALMPPHEQPAEALRRGPYTRPALVPVTDWFAGDAPAVPEIAWREDATLRLQPGSDAPVRRWVVRVLNGDAWTLTVLPGTARTHRFAEGRPDAVVVTAVDRLGRESARTTWPGVTGTRQAAW